MAKTNSVASNSHLSSSCDQSFPLTNSKKGEATTSKPTAIKKAAAVLADPKSESYDSESETLVATKKAKSRKGKSSHTIKKAAAVKADPESESADSESETKTRKEKSRHTIKKAAVVSKQSTPAKRVAVVSPDEPSVKKGKSSGSFQSLCTEEEEEEIALSKEMVNYAEDAEDEDAEDAEDEDEEDTEDEDAEDAEDEDEDAAEDETNNVCKTKKEWKFIGKKSIALGLNAEFVNAGMERCSDAVKLEIEEEWEQYHLEKAALFQKQLNLVIKETNCIVQAYNK